MQTTTRVLLLSAATVFILIGSINLATAQILEKDSIANLPIGGNATLGDIDVAIDPTDEPLPPNGTLSVSTDRATDYDITSMVPQGMTIVIDNTTATVTNHPVTIGSADE
jgi:hypothetical protein